MHPEVPSHASQTHLPLRTRLFSWFDIRWLLVFGGFMSYMLADGSSYSFGVLYLALLDEFRQSHLSVSWIGALLYGVPQLTGPLACTVVDVFDSRVASMLGAFIVAFAFILTLCAQSIRVLYITMGVMLAAGLRLVYVSAIVKVSNIYVGPHLSMALGCLTCGSGVGIIVFSIMFQWLTEVYTWRGACLVTSALVFNVAVSGALLHSTSFPLILHVQITLNSLCLRKILR